MARWLDSWMAGWLAGWETTEITNCCLLCISLAPNERRMTTTAAQKQRGPAEKS